MPGELSHGLAALSTAGNRIVRSGSGEAVLLRGVNLSGMEYSSEEITEEEIREMVAGWGCNVIRLPFNQDWALRRTGYLDAVDRVISLAAAAGAYTILDLQWLDAVTLYGGDNHVPPSPNPESIDLWRSLAERYRDEPAVLFDLLNEPHDRLPDDSLPVYELDPLGRIVASDRDCVGAEEWSRWASRLVAEIRGIRPDGLILVSGVDWAFDLRDVRVDAPNIVYSAHIYSNRKAADWWKALGDWEDVPIFVAEWGGTDDDLDFGARLAELMRRRGLGWTAWSWVDNPPLVRAPRAPNYEPTAFGELVRNELRR